MASEPQVFTIKCKIPTSPGHGECVLRCDVNILAQCLVDGKSSLSEGESAVGEGCCPLQVSNMQQDPPSPSLATISHCANQPQHLACLCTLQNHIKGLAPRAISNLWKILGDLGLQPPTLLLWAWGSPSLGPSIQVRSESNSPVQHYRLTQGKSDAPRGKGSCFMQT